MALAGSIGWYRGVWQRQQEKIEADRLLCILRLNAYFQNQTGKEEKKKRGCIY